LLLGGGDELPEGWARDDDDDEDVDMEITFTPGLSESKGTGDETTLEKYQRKMKEKRKQKKIESKPIDTTAEADEFFDEEGGVPAPPKKSSTSSKKRDTVSVEKPSRSLSTVEELALLVSSDTHNTEPRHFDMKAIIKAEKQAKRKGKKKKTGGWGRGERDAGGLCYRRR